MKKIEEIQLPEELRYSPDHEWVRTENGLVRIGITDYAQDQLGDIVYCELPSGRCSLRAGGGLRHGRIGEVRLRMHHAARGGGQAVNAALADDPALLNSSPYGDGWMVLVKPDDPAAGERLLTAERYREHLRGVA